MILTLEQCRMRGLIMEPSFLLREISTLGILVFDTDMKALVPIPAGKECDDARLDPAFRVVQHVSGGFRPRSHRTEDVLRHTLRIRGSLSLAELELLRMQLRTEYPEPKVCYLLNVCRKKSFGCVNVLATVYGKAFADALCGMLERVPTTTETMHPCTGVSSARVTLRCTGNCFQAYLCNHVFMSIVISSNKKNILWMFIASSFKCISLGKKLSIVQSAAQLLLDGCSDGSKWFRSMNTSSRLDLEINGPHDAFFEMLK